MNRKQFLLIAAVVVVVGGLGLFVSRKQSSAWKATSSSLGGSVLGDFPVNDVSQLVIKQGTNELTLAKKDDLWRVKERGDYPANFAEISEFLRQAVDLKFVQRQNIGASLLPRLELTPPGEGTNSGTLVELKDKEGKLIRSLLLGKKHLRRSSSPSPFGDDAGWPDGRYLMVNNDPNQVGLVSNPLTSLEPKPENWLNKDFFKIEGIKAVAIVTDKDTNWWRVARESLTNDFKLIHAKDGEQLDQSKIGGLGSVLSSPSFNDVMPPPSDLKSIGFDKPRVATIETFDGFSYKLKLAKKDEDNYYAQLSLTAAFPRERQPGKDEKPEDKEKLDKEFKERLQKLDERLAADKAYENWIYLVSKWTLDPLLKERSELLVEKKEEPKKGEAAKEGEAK
jgi:hypothetical protein